MIINYRLEKIAIEKKTRPKGPVEAKNSLRITDIKEEPISSLTKDNALNMQFSFAVTYEPNIALLEMVGSVTYLAEVKKAQEILQNWKKNKKIKQEVAAPIFNFILAKCNIKALSLEQDVELPYHLPIPRLKSKAEVTGKKPAKAS